MSVALYVAAVAVAWTLAGEYGMAGAIVISLPVLGPAMLCVAPCMGMAGGGGDCGDLNCDGCELVPCGNPGDIGLPGFLGSCSNYFCLFIIFLIWFTIAVIIVTGGVVIISTTSRPTDIVPAENHMGAIAAGILAILSGLLCAGSVFPCIYLWLSKECKNRRTPRTAV